MDNQPSADSPRRPPPRPDGQPQAAGGRLLVCLNSSPAAGPLVRSAGRLAAAAQAEWFAVYVETPDDHPSLEDQDQISKTLRLAAQLGGQAVKLSGFNLRDALLTFAREQGVTKIVLAQIRQPRWRRLLGNSLAAHLLRGGDFDLHLISATGQEPAPKAPPGWGCGSSSGITLSPPPAWGYAPVWPLSYSLTWPSPTW